MPLAAKNWMNYLDTHCQPVLLPIFATAIQVHHRRHLLSLPLTQFFSDSIFFIKKKADPLDLDIHPAAIGSLKYEEPEGYRVADAYFLQPKSYLLSFAKDNASLPTRQV